MGVRKAEQREAQVQQTFLVAKVWTTGLEMVPSEVVRAEEVSSISLASEPWGRVGLLEFGRSQRQSLSSAFASWDRTRLEKSANCDLEDYETSSGSAL